MVPPQVVISFYPCLNLRTFTVGVKIIENTGYAESIEQGSLACLGE